MAYKENIQTLDCCELCSLVRDKTIISSPSRPNPQAACRVMIGTVLSHLLCMPLGTRHSQHTRAAATALGAQPGGAGRGAPHASPPPPGRHIWNDPQLLPLLAPGHLFFLYLLRKHFPPSLPLTPMKSWGFQSVMGWFTASWALICGYKEVSLARGALPGWVYLRSCCCSSRLLDNLVVTSPGGCSKSGAIFFRRAGTYKIIKYVKSV